MTLGARLQSVGRKSVSAFRQTSNLPARESGGMRYAFPPYNRTRLALAQVILQTLRLDEDAGDFGELCLDRAFDLPDGALDLRR